MSIDNATLVEKYGGTVVSFSDLLHLAEPEFLIAPLIRTGTVHSLTAKADTGKSLLALEMALALATGRRCLEQPAGGRKRVLYLDYEMGPKRLKKRLLAMGVDLHDGTPDGFRYRYDLRLPSLDTKKGGKALRALVDVERPDLLVIDTLSKAVLGDESSNTTYSRFWRYSLASLQADGVSVLLTDHEGHKAKGRARGASAKKDNVDVSLVLERQKGGSKHDLQVVRDKDRDGEGEDSAEVVLKLHRVTEPYLHLMVGNRPTGAVSDFRRLAIDFRAAEGALPSANALVELRRAGSKRDAVVALRQLREEAA